LKNQKRYPPDPPVFEPQPPAALLPAAPLPADQAGEALGSADQAGEALGPADEGILTNLSKHGKQEFCPECRRVITDLVIRLRNLVFQIRAGHGNSRAISEALASVGPDLMDLVIDHEESHSLKEHTHDS